MVFILFVINFSKPFVIAFVWLSIQNYILSLFHTNQCMWHVSTTSDFDVVCLRSSKIHLNWILEFLKHNTDIASFKMLKDQRSNEYDNQIPQYAAETIPKPHQLYHYLNTIMFFPCVVNTNYSFWISAFLLNAKSILFSTLGSQKLFDLYLLICFDVFTEKIILRVYCFVYHEQGVLMVGFIKFIVYCYFPPGDWDLWCFLYCHNLELIFI